MKTMIQCLQLFNSAGLFVGIECAVVGVEFVLAGFAVTFVGSRTALYVVFAFRSAVAAVVCSIGA